MITKKQIKYYRSLQKVKYRNVFGRFLVSGDKAVRDVIASGTLSLCSLLAEQGWIDNYSHLTHFIPHTHIVSPAGLKLISEMKSVPPAIVEVEIPSYDNLDSLAETGMYFFLDGIQNPGNLGTIIRTCTWFGFSHLILSTQCANPYSPKVVQATMSAIGSICFINSDLASIKTQFPNYVIYGADMTGRDLNKMPKDARPNIIVIGSEGQGFSDASRLSIHQTISIPKKSSTRVESLNAAVATAIIANHFSKDD